MKKEIRERVWNKYGKRCAYCGCELEYSKMQVDHRNPIYRNDSDEDLERMGVVRGKEEESNFEPACKRCNWRKNTLTVDKFREEINLQVARLFRDSSQYRLALDFKQVKITYSPVVFWFER